MRLFIHDLAEEMFQELVPNLPENSVVIANNSPIKSCVGCFGCWVKTPSACVIRDKYGDMGKLLSRCDYLVIISKCVYGGFSPFVKNVLDRSISYLHPDFIIKNNEMHHRLRYENHFGLSVCFYGEGITENEHQTATKLVMANAVNWDCSVKKIYFLPNARRIEGLPL